MRDWKKYIARISPPDKPRRGSAPSPPSPEPEADAGRLFYGIPLPKGDFVFVLDASASMNRKVDGVKVIDQVVRRVRDLLDEMRNGQKFNIVFFNAGAKVHLRRLVPRSDDSARIAGRFLNKIRAEGPTNLEAGLRAALRDPDVGEIILLSDGVPNRGAVRSSTGVQFMLGRRRVRIHTVGTRESASLMKNIARETGGHYGEL